MPVLERSEEEPHFSEGEPDLEPPEELAVGEIDDETMLEEELDNEDVLEQDVDEEVLAVTLEDLVHMDDGDGPEKDDSPTDEAELDLAASAILEEELEVLDVDELEDLEEGLDTVLDERLAVPGPSDSDGGEVEGDGATRLSPVLSWTLAAAAERVTPCQQEEFVCRSCFLVRHRALLADPQQRLCRDCAY
jgi:hypothetical protein